MPDEAGGTEPRNGGGWKTDGEGWQFVRSFKTLDGKAQRTVLKSQPRQSSSSMDLIRSTDLMASHVAATGLRHSRASPEEALIQALDPAEELCLKLGVNSRGAKRALKCQPFLKHGQIQRVPQFEAVKRGEGQRVRVGRAPSVGFRRIGVRRVEREQQAGVGVGLHQRSSERDTSTMLGRTLSPKIWRRRAA